MSDRVREMPKPGKEEVTPRVIKTLQVFAGHPDRYDSGIVQCMIKGVEERNQVGIDRYGTPLETFNELPALKNSREETYDQLQYMMQDIRERLSLGEIDSASLVDDNVNIAYQYAMKAAYYLEKEYQKRNNN